MPRYSTAFGMDVHLRSTTVCALDAETVEAVTRRFRGNPWGEVAEWMSGFPGPSLAAYESGYLGFAPQRELSGLGVDCVVAAVSKVPRSAADLSSKNDRNDAARMAKAILSHDVTPVWVPSPEIEGLRDLAAAHDAAAARLAAAKQRLLAFLARRGYVYGGTTPAGNPRKYWTYGFLRWLDGIHPADDGGIRALAALRNEVEAADETREGPPRRVQGRRRGGPPLGRGRGAPVDQGVRVRARRRLRVRGRRLLEVPLRQAGDGLLRPRPEAEVERRLRATRRNQRGRQRARQEAGGRGVLALRPGRAPAQADAQGLRSPARDKDAREEGVRAPAPATRGDAREGHAPGEGERRHRRRAREVAVGPRRDVPGGRRIDIAPVPASRAAFGDTPVLAVRAAAAASASTDLGNPAEGEDCGPPERYPRI